MEGVVAETVKLEETIPMESNCIKLEANDDVKVQEETKEPSNCDETKKLDAQADGQTNEVKAEAMVEQEPSDCQDADGEENMDANDDANDDVYSYAKRGEFTCENFKIELGNLPKYLSYTCLKKLIEKKCQVKPHKIKVIKGNGNNYSFISFRSEEERDKVMGLMDGLRWKNKVLFAKKANPAKDPLIKKRKQDDRRVKETPIEDGIDAGDKLNDKVCPLWRTPYEEQLKIKRENYVKFLVSLRREIAGMKESPADSRSNSIKWANSIGKKYDGSICLVDAIKASPVTSGYRNKCEFSIGPGKIVGFRLGLYKEGSISVVTPPENCPIVSPKMRAIIGLFQKYLQTSLLKEFNNVNHEGFWRQLTVRCTQLDSMIIISVHPQSMTTEELEEEKLKIKNFFAENEAECQVTSLYFHPYITRNKVTHDQSELQLIDGKPAISETMKDGSLTLKISPFAFFQTNTKAAEVCYQTIEELAGLNESSIVLDICCGTGTIGIYMADRVKYVIGLEINADALKDARHNTQVNNISNIEFVEGKAEAVIESVITKAQDKFGKDVDLTAIIDPPRAGLHPSVIKTLRATPNLKKLIYVACEPKIAQKNLIDLSRPTSNAYKGTPFVPTRAVPVDMFPHTSHCELLLLYQRLESVENFDVTPSEQPSEQPSELPSELPTAIIPDLKMEDEQPIPNEV